VETTYESINTKGILHDIAEDAIQLNNMLVWFGVDTLPAEVQASREELYQALQAERPMSNGDLCAIANECAFMVAAILDPTEGMDMINWVGGEPSRILVDLLRKLVPLGLMDNYTRENGGFGIW